MVHSLVLSMHINIIIIILLHSKALEFIHFAFTLSRKKGLILHIRSLAQIPLGIKAFTPLSGCSWLVSGKPSVTFLQCADLLLLIADD